MGITVKEKSRNKIGNVMSNCRNLLYLYLNFCPSYNHVRGHVSILNLGKHRVFFLQIVLHFRPDEDSQLRRPPDPDQHPAEGGGQDQLDRPDPGDLHGEGGVLVTAAAIGEPRGPPRGCLLGADVEIFPEHAGHVPGHVGG